jgi:cytochrome c556
MLPQPGVTCWHQHFEEGALKQGKVLIRKYIAGAAVYLVTAGAAASDDIEYRQNVLKAVGGHLNASVAIVRGEVPHRDQLIRHARSIAEMSQIAPMLFPPGSGTGNTNALPAIWERTDTFSERLEAFQAAAVRFHEVVANDQDAATVGRSLLELGQACRNCHDTFRAK